VVTSRTLLTSSGGSSRTIRPKQVVAHEASSTQSNSHLTKLDTSPPGVTGWVQSTPSFREGLVY
jgi:hypothetical protein